MQPLEQRTLICGAYWKDFFSISGGVFRDTFTRLHHIKPEIVYPIPNFGALDQPEGQLGAEWNVPKTDVLFLSINRYERKKNLPLALQALGR